MAGEKKPWEEYGGTTTQEAPGPWSEYGGAPPPSAAAPAVKPAPTPAGAAPPPTGEHWYTGVPTTAYREGKALIGVPAGMARAAVTPPETKTEGVIGAVGGQPAVAAKRLLVDPVTGAAKTLYDWGRDVYKGGIDPNNDPYGQLLQHAPEWAGQTAAAILMGKAGGEVLKSGEGKVLPVGEPIGTPRIAVPKMGEGYTARPAEPGTVYDPDAVRPEIRSAAPRVPYGGAAEPVESGVTEPGVKPIGTIARPGPPTAETSHIQYGTPEALPPRIRAPRAPTNVDLTDEEIDAAQPGIARPTVAAAPPTPSMVIPASEPLGPESTIAKPVTAPAITAQPVAPEPTPIIARPPENPPPGRTITGAVEASKFGPKTVGDISTTVSELRDAKLQDLAEERGIDPDDYDLKKRDTNRHRVDRDRLAKDITNSFTPEEVADIQNTRSGLLNDPEHTALHKADQAARYFKDLASGNTLEEGMAGWKIPPKGTPGAAKAGGPEFTPGEPQFEGEGESFSEEARRRGLPMGTPEDAIAAGGGKFKGIQEGIPEVGIKPQYLFNDSHGSTLSLPEDQVTPEAVRAKVQASNYAWEHPKK